MAAINFIRDYKAGYIKAETDMLIYSNVSIKDIDYKADEHAEPKLKFVVTYRASSTTRCFPNIFKKKTINEIVVLKKDECEVGIYETLVFDTFEEADQFITDIIEKIILNNKIKSLAKEF